MKTTAPIVRVAFDNRRGNRGPFPRLGYFVDGHFIPIGQSLRVTLQQFDPDAQNQAVTPASQEPVAQTSPVILGKLPYFEEACAGCRQEFKSSKNQKRVQTDIGLTWLIICPSCGQMHT